MTLSGMRAAVAAIVVFLGGAGPVWAQQRPLVSEDPETVGAGRVLLEGGFDWGRNQLFPVSGLEGNLLRAPLLGVSVGVSSIAEIQVDGGLYNHLAITNRRPAALPSTVSDTASGTSSVEDLVIGAKVRLHAEGPGRPALGVRFATRLPNASNESGLGLDTTDFLASLLVGKTVESVRFVGNFGLGILGDPTRGDRQNDVLTYGLSVARAMTTDTELVGEVSGRVSTRSGSAPPGTETRGMIRLAGRYTVRTIRFDAGVMIGTTTRDPGFGIMAGATYVFDAFKVP